ncbi:hypothetical protein BKA65DRAFT_507127 [Rhexocercosporidium sp. MPI-PUGE-AT-0058]|nr:hypothetical protein BKA65DRAFT_507127 [Rhexocercosporidium sp. MPI-PUGE-AT-0058]
MVSWRRGQWIILLLKQLLLLWSACSFLVGGSIGCERNTIEYIDTGMLPLRKVPQSPQSCTRSDSFTKDLDRGETGAGAVGAEH